MATDQNNANQGTQSNSGPASAGTALMVEDFERIDIDSAIAASEQKRCSYYWRIFQERIDETDQQKNEKAKAAWVLLYKLCFLRFTPSAKSEPFGPMMTFDNGRSFVPDDLTSEERALLCGLAPGIKDDELRARIADIAWLTTRDHRCARLAVDAYMASAFTLENSDGWPPCVQRFERALRLAVSLGPSQELPLKVVQELQETVRKYNGDDSSFLSAKLMDLLLEFRPENPEEFGSLSQKAAQKAETEGNSHRAREYWSIAANWYLKADKPDERSIALLAEAETYVSDAEAAVQGDSKSYLAAAQHLTKAIEAYRRIGGQKARVDELHHKLLLYEQESLKELQSIEIPGVDVSELVQQARTSVSGLEKRNALIHLVLLARPTDFRKMRENAVEAGKKFIFASLFPGVHLDESGKVVARHPSSLSDGSDEAEKALWSQILQQAAISREIDVRAILNPARQQILLEHAVTRDDFEEIVINNPFVPAGREGFFVEGLYSGMIGDFAQAIHFLIPQIENSMRYVLKQKGVITTKIDDYGIQKEMILDDLLRNEEAEQAFTKNTILCLRSVLVDKQGPNLRHRLAHGLLSYEECFSIPAFYTWWLCLQLCCIPLIKASTKTSNSAK